MSQRRTDYLNMDRFGGIEDLLGEWEPDELDIRSEAPVTLIDESGQTIHVKHLPTLYTVLASEAMIAEIKEVEELTGVKAEAHGHRAALEASVSGFVKVTAEQLENARKTASMDFILISAEAYLLIRQVTGHTPGQNLTDEVFGMVARYGQVPGLNMNLVDKFLEVLGTIPSPDVQQQLYFAAVTGDTGLSEHNIANMFLKFGKTTPPKLKGQSEPVHVRDYVIAVQNKTNGVNRIRFDKGNLALANFNQASFIPEMTAYFADLDVQEGYRRNDPTKIIHYLDQAVLDGKLLPESVAQSLPTHLIMALGTTTASRAYVGAAEFVLERLETEGVYSVDKPGFAAALESCFEALHQDLDNRLSGRPMRNALRGKVSSLKTLANSLAVDITDNTQSYITKITSALDANT